MMRAVLPQWSQSRTDTIIDAQMPFSCCRKVTRSVCHLFRSHSEEQRMDSLIHMEKSRKPIAEIVLAKPAEGRARCIPPVELCVDKAWFGEHSSG